MKVVRTLLRSGSALDKADNSLHRTPLALAVCNGHAGVVKELCAARADLDAAGYDGSTPLLCPALRFGVSESRQAHALERR